MMRRILMRHVLPVRSIQTHPYQLSKLSCAHQSTHQKTATANQSLLFNKIKSDSTKKCAFLSFKDMIKYPESYNKQLHLIGLSDFVRQQLLILIANIIIDFNNLPYKINENDKIQEIINIYLQCYDGIKSIPNIKSTEDVNQFDTKIKEYMTLGTDIVAKLCITLKEMGQTQQSELFNIEECPYLANFIDVIIKRRLAIRTLLSHYRSLNNEWGIFENNCDIIHHIHSAVNDARLITMETFGIKSVPHIFVHDKRKYESANFTFIPEMIRKFSFELLKNAMRSAMERGNFDTDDNCNRDCDACIVECIRVVVVNSKCAGQVTIKIADKGGGISRGNMNKIWLYSYTDSNENIHINGKSQMELLAQVEQPMYGLGYGLPVLSAEIQFLGGDCKIHSMDGYGTDAYLLLPNLRVSNSNVLAMR